MTDRQEAARRELRRIAEAERRKPAAIREARAAGVQQKDIAADLGVTRDTVRRIERAIEAEEAAGQTSGKSGRPATVRT